MVETLAKIIIGQFVGIVEKRSEECHIKWDKCAFKLVSRQYFDRLVIEIGYKETKCDPLNVFLSNPLVIIDFTDIKEKNLDNPQWIAYLEKKASLLLTKIEEKKGKLLPEKCCSGKHDCAPTNKCDCIYREEYYLCRDKKPECDKPYDQWGKPCKKEEHKCKNKPEPDCHKKSHKCTDKSESSCHKKKYLKPHPKNKCKCNDSNIKHDLECVSNKKDNNDYDKYAVSV